MICDPLMIWNIWCSWSFCYVRGLWWNTEPLALGLGFACFMFSIVYVCVFVLVWKPFNLNHPLSLPYISKSSLKSLKTWTMARPAPISQTMIPTTHDLHVKLTPMALMPQALSIFTSSSKTSKITLFQVKKTKTWTIHQTVKMACQQSTYTI